MPNSKILYICTWKDTQSKCKKQTDLANSDRPTYLYIFILQISIDHEFCTDSINSNKNNILFEPSFLVISI